MKTQKDSLRDFISSALTEQLEELERWVEEESSCRGEDTFSTVDADELIALLHSKKEEYKKV